MTVLSKDLIAAGGRFEVWFTRIDGERDLAGFRRRRDAVRFFRSLTVLEASGRSS